jgi:hypothetical protein
MTGAWAACSAATTMAQKASWSHRKSCPVNAIASVASSSSEPESQLTSRGNLNAPKR